VHESVQYSFVLHDNLVFDTHCFDLFGFWERHPHPELSLLDDKVDSFDAHEETEDGVVFH